MVKLAGEVVQDVRNHMPKGLREEEVLKVAGVMVEAGKSPPWKWEVLRQ